VTANALAGVSAPDQYLTAVVHLSEGGTATREVTGLALPYGEDLDRPDWFSGAVRQRFAPESAQVRENAQLFYGHDHLNLGLPIGRITSSEHTDEGLRITARISETPKGDEVYTLLKDGVLDRFSVGYRPITAHLEDDDLTLVHDSVEVFEASVVPDPAYQSATVDSVLARTNTKETKMTETQTLDPATLASAEDVQTLSASIENLERRIATLGAGAGAPDDHVAPGHSYGEFVQMLARGEKEAVDFLAYAGGTIGDLGDWVKDSWVGDIYRPITENRRLHNLFESSPLPATGMNVEFGKLLADTTDVDEQAAEGDVLAYGGITFETDTAPIKTYGGWGEMSRQEIDRSSVAVVEKFYSALVNRYAKVTEAALRTVAADVANAHVLAGAGTHNLATADGWIDYTVDSAIWLDDKGLAPEFVLVGFDVFKTLAKLRDGDNADAPRLLDRASGTVNIVSLTGQLFNLPVIPVNSAGLVRIGHSSAIRTFEAGGAPFRMQDDDITNLTSAFSIYGYEAIAVQDTDALVAPDATA
jgi:HK97 family phage prohead protease/HK97 family phage major capsid protein